MSLTFGTSPFGDQPGGQFNFTRQGPAQVLYFEDSPRWVRGLLGDQVVVSSRRVKLLHESQQLPVWYFPREDVRLELLEESGRSGGEAIKGPKVSYRLRTAGSLQREAAWCHLAPPEGAPPLAGYIAFHWDALDAWYEEAEQVFVHPRDPYHRVDVRRSARRIRLSLEGVLLAESSRPAVLFETGLPPRHYLPAEDLRMELLVPSDTLTRCPYKGTAQYRSARVGGRLVEDLVWSYPEPLPEVAKIAGHFAFWDERMDVEVEGLLQERPRTAWSKRWEG